MRVQRMIGAMIRTTTKMLAGTALSALLFAGAVTARAQDKPAQSEPTPEQKFLAQLNKGKYALTLVDGKVSGAGMNVLSDATADAQFVLIGEDHGIRQIPQFAASVFEMLAPRGFHTLALETGPEVTPSLEEFASGPVSGPDGGAAQLSKFNKKFPFTLAFYGWQKEFAFLQRCARATKGGKVDLWGLDQELMGSSVYLLPKIAHEKLGRDASAMAEQLIKKNDDAYAGSAKTGDPSGLFMLSASDDELNAFSELLKTQGTPRAQEILAALMKSRDIYKKNMGNEGFASNRERSLLMKENFKRDYTAATDAGDAMPKVMFKFGAYHMYRGINMIHNNDIGNMVAELAGWNGKTSVHIMILGVKGTQLAFAGIGKPGAVASLDLKSDPRGDFNFLAPMFDNMLAGSWTMYDMRGLRPHFGAYGKLDTELERVIFGYDFVVLVPDPAASHDLE
jgi:erythromycin esterase-like protein